MGATTPLLLATGNVDKAREICEVLADAWSRPLGVTAVHASDGTPVGFVVGTPATLPDVHASLVPPATAPDVAEVGTTLEENARIKARAVGAALVLRAVADDTGLEVDALDGAPGVHAARYAGPDADAGANLARLLHELEGVPTERRTARFATVMLVRDPDGSEHVVRGVVEGTIAVAPRGVGGFGYDPVFIPSDGDGRTFAEMTAREKHACSHRGRAVRALAARLAAESGPGGRAAYAPDASEDHDRG